ncbi:proteoglycan 4 [Kryptolebias marmoratus]|uniref:proteoglycan 4 n=1 Tax=Kryptolebias marmoratus TaxID=37003 RepID=UPI0007F92BE6|nr:proteoglycan 4 [Kryptolebias marmoratus]
MSDQIDRKQVLHKIKVRKPLKRDGCWIKPRDNPAASEEKNNPPPVIKGLCVLSAARKFDDCANQANNEVNPVQKESPSNESKVDTVGDTKLQSPTEQLISNSKTQADKLTEENKKIEASAAIDKSNVENKEKADEVSADNEEQIQPAPVVKQDPEAAVPVEPADTTPAKRTAAEDKEEQADPPPEPSNIDNNEARAPADAKVENCVPEVSAAEGTSGSSVTAEVPAALEVQPEPREESVIKTEPANTTSSEEENKDASIQTANGSEEKCPPQEPNEDAVFTAVKFMVESLPETADDTEAAGEDASLQAGVDSDLLVEPLGDSPTQSDNETPTESCSDKGSPEQNKRVIVEILVEAPETPVVVNATPTEEAPPLDGTQPVSDTLCESPAAVKSAECESDSAGPAEPVLGTRTEEVVECAPEQSVELPLADAADLMTELNIEDAVQPSPAENATAAQDNSASRAINLSDALDVESQSDKSVPEPEDSEQTIPEQLKQQCDDTNTSDRFQKPAEKLNSTETQTRSRYGRSTCSYCNRAIDGNTRFIMSEPAVICHPECLECGVCAKALGDLLTRMFVHDKVIHCGDCFQKAVNV